MAVADRPRPLFASETPTAPIAAPAVATQRFPALDGFRGLAALGVLVFHVAGNTDVSTHDGFVSDALARLGNYGVTVFFVLSGFLLYRQFVLAELRGDAFPRVRRFYWHRFLRIYPAYWLALTVTILLAKNGDLPPGRGNIYGFGQYVELYSLMQNYRKEVFISGLFVAWTLSIEVAFYLVLPPLAWLFRKLGDLGSDDGQMNLSRRLRTQLLCLAAMIVAANLFRWWALNLGNRTDGFPIKWLDGGPIRWLPSYLDWYALGMLAAVISAWAQIGRPVVPWLKSLVSTPWLCIAMAVTGYWYLIMLDLPHGDFKAAPVGDDLAHYVFAGLSAFFLLLPGFLGPQDRGLVRKVMGGRIMAYVGLTSYGIYLWHPLAVDRLSKMRDDNKFGVPFTPGFWTVLVAVLVFSVVCATISYYGLERPVMRFKHPGSALRRGGGAGSATVHRRSGGLVERLRDPRGARSSTVTIASGDGRDAGATASPSGSPSDRSLPVG